MLAVESARVCSRSPEKTAADFGTSLPFSQAGPFVYNIAVGVSPARAICAGNTIASKQHTTDRNADSDIFRITVRITPAFFDFAYTKPANGYRSMRFRRGTLQSHHDRTRRPRHELKHFLFYPEAFRRPFLRLSHRPTGWLPDDREPSLSNNFQSALL